VFHDLYPLREAEGAEVAILRLEQLYPFPGEALAAQLATLEPGIEVRFLQEEPANMGPWPSLADQLRMLVGEERLRLVARPPAGSPATGSAKLHEAEQQALLRMALA
jgi:2-oxoglutarate dehydrogenase E1 component